jgi:hypothetical protein
LNPNAGRISLRTRFLLLTLHLHTIQRLPASDFEQRYSDCYHSRLETEPFPDTRRAGLDLANISLSHAGITSRHEREKVERKITYLPTWEIFTSLWGMELIGVEWVINLLWA